jgi:hypothetical protein
MRVEHWHSRGEKGRTPFQMNTVLTPTPNRTWTRTLTLTITPTHRVTYIPSGSAT